MQRNIVISLSILIFMCTAVFKASAQRDSFVAEKIAELLFVQKNYPAAMKILKTVDVEKSKYQERLSFLEVYCLLYNNQKALAYEKGLKFFEEKKEVSFDDYDKIYPKLMISQLLVSNYLSDKDYVNALLLLFKEQRFLTGDYQVLLNEGLPLYELQRRNRVLSNICSFLLGDDSAIEPLLIQFLLLYYQDIEANTTRFFKSNIEDGGKILRKIETFLSVGLPLSGCCNVKLVGKEHAENLPVYGIDLMQLVVDRLKQNGEYEQLKSYIDGLKAGKFHKYAQTDCYYINVGLNQIAYIGNSESSIAKTVEKMTSSYFYREYLSKL